ncbi:MAG: BrnA antitoxin family protein [Pseudodesulfovibrio sp.]|uniref:BrnA antitoxin family protein n=1 Tax=Pseudodesulfovibrio sp. TaxID=2035812 RepID=UPI003D0E6177
MSRQSRSDLARLEAMTDDETRRNAAADPDALPTDEAFWADADLVVPEKKVPVHIRLTPSVVAYFKRQGPGYQSRINQVLEHYVEHQQKAARRAEAE